MQIRRATLNDLDAIETLWQEMVDFHLALDDYYSLAPEAHTNHREYMVGLIQDETRRIFVAEDNGPCATKGILSLILPWRALNPDKLEDFVQPGFLFMKPSGSAVRPAQSQMTVKPLCRPRLRVRPRRRSLSWRAHGRCTCGS